MNEDKRKKLEATGWSIGNAEDFLQMSDEEIQRLNFKYKGYEGKVDFDFECNMWNGRVIISPDVVTFKGVTKDEAYIAFKDSVDDYLEMCKEF